MQKSDPYYDGATVYWTTLTQDLLGRPLLTTRPDNSTQSVSYSGLEEISTNELGQTKTVIRDALGRLVEVIDTNAQSITYEYDAIGQRVTMTDPDLNTITTTWDLRGNETSKTDPDKGTWTYDYNALGLLVSQTDAKGQVTEMTYDVLGRVLTRVDDATAANPGERTATWVYDTAAQGVGKLHTVSMPGYDAESVYDTLGRPSDLIETIDGVAYTLTTTYDSAGRVDETIYPTGLSAQNVYNSYGHLVAVRNAASLVEYWRALAQDARGNITNVELGNGVETHRVYDTLTGYLDSIYSFEGTSVLQDLDLTFDAAGNMTRREDTRQALAEDFTYDALNRVTRVDTHLDVSTTVTVTIDYDILGNITSKSDVGAYTYGIVNGGCASGHAGPHALTNVSGAKNADYCYDANGNMVSGDGRAVTYSAFDKPTEITQGANTVAVAYGPDRGRFSRTDTTSSGTTTTVYVGGRVFEEVTLASGTIERKHYIGDFAVVTETDDGVNPATATTDYLLRDHLGPAWI